MITDPSQISPEMTAYFNASLWPEEQKKLAELANRSSGHYILELGVLRGKTTAYLANNTDKAILAIDPYEMVDNDNTEIKADFHRNCDEHLRTGRIIHIQSRSDEAHQYMTEHVVGNCALVFIDWDGSMEDHYRDIVEYYPYLAPDGYLAIHDYFDRGTSQKGAKISDAIDLFMKSVEKPVVWESMLYYPKYSEMRDSMKFYGGDPEYFYTARSRGLVWAKLND